MIQPTLTPRPYRVLRPMAWRDAPDGRVELDDPRGGPVVRFHAWVRDVLEGVSRGDSYQALGTIWPGRDEDGATRELRARRFVLQLHTLGYVEIPLNEEERPRERYEIVSELGRGAMGVAHLCREPSGGEAVVVKTSWDFLHPRALGERALRREVAVLDTLHHPGIPTLRATWEENGRLRLARDYVTGRDLRRHHRAGLEAARARDMVAQVADIVAHVHERGWLLLDLGPANFLGRSDGAISLLDVGLAREAPSGFLRLDAPQGAPGFVAPETLREALASVRSEVWSIGALYAFLRTGHPPGRNADVEPLLARLPEVDAALVRRLCAADPSERPASAKEAAGALRG